MSKSDKMSLIQYGQTPVSCSWSVPNPPSHALKPSIVDVKFTNMKAEVLIVITGDRRDKTPHAGTPVELPHVDQSGCNNRVWERRRE